METYCVSCKKNTVNKSPSFRRTKQNRLMLASNCSLCSMKNQGLLEIKMRVNY